MANYPPYSEFLKQMEGVNQQGMSGLQMQSGQQAIGTQDLANRITQQNQNIALSQSQIEAQEALDKILIPEKSFQDQLKKFLTLRPLYEPVLGKDYMDKKLLEIQTNAGIAPATGQPAAAPAPGEEQFKTPLAGWASKMKAASTPNKTVKAMTTPIIQKTPENPNATVAKHLINKIFGKNLWGKG